MAPRKRYQYSLSGFLDRTCRKGSAFLVCFSLAGSLSVSLYGQQVEAPATNAAISQAQSGNAVGSGSDDLPEQEVNPAIALQPDWLFSH
jgi:hypothetical protein